MTPGKVLMIIGASLIFVGLRLHFGGKMPFPGRLPEAIRIQRKGFSLLFLFGTSAPVSLAPSLLWGLFPK